VAKDAAPHRARKRFGQHFLHEAGVIARIVRAIAPRPGDALVEIGPGLGALTGELAARAGRLYLVEVDPALANRLAARFAGEPRVQVVAGDVLSMPLEDVVSDPVVTVVANLPYNIAMPILFRLLDARARFPRAVLMLQREMAQRLAAAPGTAAYGVASVLVQAFADVRIAFGVSRRSFLPRPDVDSAVVDVRWSAAARANIGDVALFRAVVRAAFGQRRKMLRNALRPLVNARGLPAGASAAALRSAGIDPTARAETLDLAAFARLTRALQT